MGLVLNVIKSHFAEIELSIVLQKNVFPEKLYKILNTGNRYAPNLCYLQILQVFCSLSK